MSAKITELKTREAYGQLEQIINDTLAPKLAELGVSCKLAGMTYGTGGTYSTLKVEVALLNPDGSAEGKDATAFKELASTYGFKPEDLGVEIDYGAGRKLKIVGLLPTRQKYPMLMEDVRTKKQTLHPPAVILRLMGREVPPAIQFLGARRSRREY